MKTEQEVYQMREKLVDRKNYLSVNNLHDEIGFIDKLKTIAWVLGIDDIDDEDLLQGQYG